MMWESLMELKKAQHCFENALKHNPCNTKALTEVASLYRLQEQYTQAIQCFNRIIDIDSQNGEIWGALGHCYLMIEDLSKAHHSYQQALQLHQSQDPNLWYGIGILYDKWGSFDRAEEAFSSVLRMDPNFEKNNEVSFRLGLIYKQQQKFDRCLECFVSVLDKPPRPLLREDLWLHIGHVYELSKKFEKAKEAYEKVLKENPNHARVLQQLGWLYHHHKHENLRMDDQEIAVSYLMRSIEADTSDGQTWYLLGRCYMKQRQYKKAYDAYQQAVYRDSKNPTVWCSIGVLFFRINQCRDALDAYKTAIKLNPFLSEVWFDLGTLYESCEQYEDSLDAYQRAADLDPGKSHLVERLHTVKKKFKKKQIKEQQQMKYNSNVADEDIPLSEGQKNQLSLIHI
eukprot:TRINITY_DN2920_c0_g1_i1.p1 TRINITY_DN2920_c0_g1~~TRINITY_DN2920_c0_g1_i1.p1  ORF type:complete len:398 (+),score=59.94 TRINITY_DN2920_c0_g1_i1:184-1377(+)